MGAAGVGVLQVVAGSPAEGAGIRPGDVIVALDETPIGSVDDLHRFLSHAPIGDVVRVSVLRGGQRLELRALLATSPE